MIKFVLFVCILSYAQAEPQKNPLQKATSELSTVSRLVNGIAIQHEINSKTLKMDEFVSEILNVDPRINGLSTLQKTDLNDVVEKMTKVSEEAKVIKTSTLDSASIENKLKTLGDLGRYLDSLKKVETKQLVDLKKTVEFATQSNQQLFSFTGFNTAARRLQDILRPDKASADVLNEFMDNFKKFETTRQSIRDYETNLNKLWVMKNVSDVLEYLEALSQTTFQFESNYNDLISILNDLEGLKSEFSVVESGLNSIEKMKDVTGILNSTQKFVESMKSNPLRNRHLTVGFSKGTSDMKLMMKEIKEDWLKRIVSDNDETGWNTLDCLNLLHPIPQGFSVDSFKSVSEKVNSLATFANNSYNLFAQIDSIQILKNETLVSLLTTIISQTNTTENSEVDNTVKTIQESENLRKLIGGLNDAASIMKKIENQDASKALNFTGIDLDLMIKGHDEFEKTQLIKSLECLKEQKFDSSKISKTLKFGSDLRALGTHSTQDKTTVPCLKQMIQFKKSYVVALGSSNNRTTRSVSYFSSLDKPLTISKDLAKGVELVRNLADLQENEQLINEVAQSEKEVLDEMKRLLPSIDTSSFTNGLLKMVQDLKSLVSRVSSEVTLGKYEKLFGAASGISGVPINSTLLINPVSTALSASNRTSESDSFRKLGRFELDYSSHQKELNTASLTVTKLKQYFDGLFSHQKEVSPENDVIAWLPAIGVSLGALGVTVFFAAGGHFAFRKWQYKKMQNDPNSFLYLIQAIPEERHRFGKAYWDDPNNQILPIHESIVRGRWGTFKKLVDNGANVNAFYSNSSNPEETSYTTPLHLAAREEDRKFVEYLIKNGAQLDLLDSEYRLASDYCPSDQKVPFPSIGKKFLRRVPPQMKPKDFKIINFADDDYRQPFAQKFGQICENLDDSTHLVFSVISGNLIDLHKYSHALPLLFCGKMIMSDNWIKKNGEKTGNKLTVDYKQDRVTSASRNGTEYHTICQIYTHIQERRIPYLAKIKAYFYGGTQKRWFKMAATVSLLGGVPMFHGLLPRHDDPIMKGDSKKHFFHYFKNRGPIFIFTEEPEEVMEKRSYLKNNNWITWMTYESFFDFVLKFEFPEFPPKKGDTIERTRLPETFRYNDDDKMADMVETEWAINRYYELQQSKPQETNRSHKFGEPQV
uniref:ANK_REP_REGION domain-containing protein n=1 Tax=Caenorhabditis tropicalis TaxID=1561998 RepID=A0A1I7TKX8_9PELO